MGRAKIPMKYIQKEKSRKLTFKERKNGLARKLNQFVSKTGAKACLIVYDNDGNNVGPMSWPEDPTIVNSMLQEYEHKKIEEAPEIFDVHKYYEIKKNKIEAKITNVRKDTLKKKYPTWHPHFQNMEENQLRDFIATVNDRIQACDHKISILKNMQHSETSFLQNNALVQNMVQESVVSSHSSQVNAIHNIPQMQQHINGTSDLPQNSSTNQLHDISKMIDFTNLGDLPPSTSTKQLSQLGDFDDSLNQLDGGVLNQASQPDQFFWKDLSFSSQSEKGNASYLIDLHPSSSTKQLSRPNDFGYWLNDGDLNWASQPNQFAWKDLSFSSQSEEGNASYLGDFPPSSSTKQLSQPCAFDDRLKQLDDGVGQFASKDLSFSSQSEEGNPNYLIDLHPSSSTKQLSQPNDFGYWLNDGDLNWASQPDQFAWKDLSFSSQSEEGNASYLGDFPPSSSTKHLSQPRAFDDRLKQLDDGVGQFASKDLSFSSQSEEGNPSYLIDLHPSSSTKQLSQPNDFGYLLNDGDLNWASQPNQFAWKDLSFSSQSEEGNASYLGDFPPSSSTKQLSQPRAFDDRLKQLDDGVGQFASKDLSFPSQSEEGNANSDDLIQWKDKF